MNRQAYFYRVPPQELHRRSQLQPEPAKTKALQTVIEMKVGVQHICQNQLCLGVCCDWIVTDKHLHESSVCTQSPCRMLALPPDLFAFLSEFLLLSL